MRTGPGTPASARTRRGARIPLAVAGSIALTVAGSLPAAAADSRPALDAGITQSHRAALGAVPAAFRSAPDSDIVQPGDTVSAIAARHGLRTEDVLHLNGLGWSSIIQPGQVLRLRGDAAPASAPTASTYTIRGGDTIVAIARAHGVGVQVLLDANGLDWSSIIYPGQTVQIPSGSAAPAAPAAPPPAAPSAASAYTVRGGDTVSGIASAHGVSVQAVLDENGLGWSSIIYPGQTLRIPGGSPAPAAKADAAGLDAEQIENARLIIRVGRELGVSDRGIAIALGTAMQESWIRNLDWGDRDSLGLFQQRPSTGWGTPEEVRDRERSTRVFFGGPSDPNGSRTRGLLDIPGWESMSFAAAAQAVQISSYPDRYARWEQPAYAWLAALG